MHNKKGQEKKREATKISVWAKFKAGDSVLQGSEYASYALTGIGRGPSADPLYLRTWGFQGKLGSIRLRESPCRKLVTRCGG